MKSDFQIALACACLTFAGCATGSVSRYDHFDQAEVAQVDGAYVSGKIFGKTVLALNPRVETRPLNPATNTAITLHTNEVVAYYTNLIITLSTNQTSAVSTNDNPPIPILPAPPQETDDEAQDEPEAIADGGVTDGGTNAVAATTNAPTATNVVVIIAPPLTNETFTSAMNVSAVRAPNGVTEVAQQVQGVTRQISVVTNNQTVITQIADLVTTETNRTVTAVTNQVITSRTNVTTLATNGVARDYYLFTELIAPADFTLATGESLVLLIDGERHAFVQTNANAAFVGRRGFTSTLYKAPEGMFEKIAKAKKVRMRLRGTNRVIERDVPRDVQERFGWFNSQLNQTAARATSGAKTEDNRKGEARKS